MKRDQEGEIYQNKQLGSILGLTDNRDSKKSPTTNFKTSSLAGSFSELIKVLMLSIERGATQNAVSNKLQCLIKKYTSDNYL